MDFLFVFKNWTFSPDVTGEALRADVDFKSAFLKEVGKLRPHFYVVEDIHSEPFLQG